MTGAVGGSAGPRALVNRGTFTVGESVADVFLDGALVNGPSGVATDSADDAGWQDLAHVLLCSNEFIYID